MTLAGGARSRTGSTSERRCANAFSRKSECAVPHQGVLRLFGIVLRSLRSTGSGGPRPARGTPVSSNRFNNKTKVQIQQAEPVNTEIASDMIKKLPHISSTSGLPEAMSETHNSSSLPHGRRKRNGTGYRGRGKKNQE